MLINKVGLFPAEPADVRIMIGVGRFPAERADERRYGMRLDCFPQNSQKSAE
jgi:hypothetical protein